MIRATATLLFFAASAIHAEELVFNTDDNVVVLRGSENFGMTTYEFIGKPGGHYQCIALDLSGDPIAATTALADMSKIMFEDLPLADVGTVKCREL